MDGWSLLAGALVCGAGALFYLRAVAREIARSERAVQNLEQRLRAERESIAADALSAALEPEIAVVGRARS